MGCKWRAFVVLAISMSFGGVLGVIASRSLQVLQRSVDNGEYQRGGEAHERAPFSTRGEITFTFLEEEEEIEKQQQHLQVHEEEEEVDPAAANIHTQSGLEWH